MSRLYESIDPTTYLDLARELEVRPDVASRRTAADRAYFAAFLTSRDQLASKNYLTPYYSINDNQLVTETLKRELGAAGNDELRLRRARNCINYDTRDLGHGVRDVCSLKWMIDTASEVIRKVKALPHNSQKN